MPACLPHTWLHLSPLHKDIRIRPVIWVQHDTDAPFYGDGKTFNHEGCFQGFQDLLDDDVDMLSSSQPRQQNCKLVSAQARDYI